jgi:predicted TIM-barrel fold metal-dependent hydrolase
MTIFSPRASAMAHHVGDQSVSRAWARANNDLIARCVALYPETFAGVCMLPQSPEADLQESVEELERCVGELGFIGCNLNPDPGGGHFRHPPLTDPYWYPFYEKMVELDVPAMIHVSGSCNPLFTPPAPSTSPPIRSLSCSSSRAISSRTSRRFASSSRMAAAPCLIIGAVTAASRTC